MTYCNTLFEPLTNKIEIDKKTLDEIAGEVCGDTVKNPRQKIIRIIKVILGEEYLIEHAQTLGYNTVKAVRQKSTTCEVVNRKIVTEVEDSDNSGQTNSITPISPCPTILQANTEHEDEAGQTKGDQVLEEPDKPAVCCRSSNAVQKVRKTDSNKNEGESWEKKGQEQVLEEQDDAPVIDVPYELVKEIKRLIGLFSLEEVKKALVVVEGDI
jgi:hypothetical protein